MLCSSLVLQNILVNIKLQKIWKMKDVQLVDSAK
jgi:hypothetical protein